MSIEIKQISKNYNNFKAEKNLNFMRFQLLIMEGHMKRERKLALKMYLLP